MSAPEPATRSTPKARRTRQRLLDTSLALFQQRGPMLKEHGYLPLIRLLKPKDQAAAE